MTMIDHTSELIPALIAAALGLALVAWILARWGKAIVRTLLALAGLAVAGLFGLAMLQQAAATREAARAVEVASAGQTISSAGALILLGVLAVVVILALLAVGYLWLRWRLAEGHALNVPRSGSYHRPRQQLSQQPVIVVLEQDLDDDLAPVPAWEWTGHWEEDVWTGNDEGLAF
jgi:hypothetical protein